MKRKRKRERILKKKERKWNRDGEKSRREKKGKNIECKRKRSRERIRQIEKIARHIKMLIRINRKINIMSKGLVPSGVCFRFWVEISQKCCLIPPNRESLLNGKDQYGWPPFTNQPGSIAFYIENIIYLFTK